jgi:4-methylaminobutanoate oxidase (formaldehyde-forming)
MGVQLLTGTAVRSLTTAGDQVVGVQTDKGRIAAPNVLISAGPWTSQLVRPLGFIVPAISIRLQQVRTEPDPDVTMHHPVVRIPDHSCYLRPEQGGYLFGFFDSGAQTIDPAARPESFRTGRIDPPIDVMDEATGRLKPVFPKLADLKVVQRRQGMVTCTPDGAYVVGPIPGRSGCWIATGCGAMGIAGCGAVGRWLAKWLLEGGPGDDLSSLSPDRFAGRTSNRQWLESRCRDTFANYYSLGRATYGQSAQA